uniref:Glycosyltransferase n=1 Tax=candidate division WOR-3 bacterium TaxID=2052148 RepID=A0A7C4GJY7_UNCW3
MTVKPVAYYAYDPVLNQDLRQGRVFRTESLDANRLFNLLRPKRMRQTPVLGRTASRLPRLLNHLMLPDAKAGWLPFASVAGRHIIDREHPAAILATAPPFTALLVGVRLKAHGHIPLVSDFRDPWPAGFTLPPGWQRGALRWIRSYVVRHSDLVLAVNKGTARAVGPDVHVLDNGFDPTDFEVPAARLEGLSVVHVGNLFENQARLLGFAEALQQVPRARLYLAGRVDPATEAVLRRNDRVVLSGVLPHREVCRLMKGADVLLYIGKPGQAVGIKLYEYLGARRPILVWGEPDSEAARLVMEHRAGVACMAEAGQVAEVLVRLSLSPQEFTSSSRDRFDRRVQARWLAERLEELVCS